MSDNTTVIVSGARTAQGRLQGSLKNFSAVDLGAVAVKGALERGNVDPSHVQYVIMGQVLTAGAGASRVVGASGPPSGTDHLRRYHPARSDHLRAQLAVSVVERATDRSRTVAVAGLDRDDRDGGVIDHRRDPPGFGAGR